MHVAFDMNNPNICIAMLNNDYVNAESVKEMNMSENITVYLGFLIVSVIIYMLVRWSRPYAKKSHETALNLVLGSGLNLLFWIVLLSIGVYLLNSNESFFRIMDSVLDTRIIFVPWAYLSYALVAFGFDLDKVSNGQVDWRIGLILFSVCLTLILCLQYYMIGIPMSPLSIP